MKLIIHQKLIIFFPLFYAFLKFYSCAAIQAPSGGPRDTTPPFLLRSNPESGSTNFKGGQVDLFFSEYLQQKTIASSIQIQPFLKEPIKIKEKGDRVSIYFPDSISSNQTYIISISRDLKDENNVPISQGIQLAYSTGENINSGEIRGKVYYNELVTLNLYKIKDSLDQIIFWERTADYSIDASDEGEYHFKFLSNGLYKILALNLKSPDILGEPDYVKYGLPYIEKIEIDDINFSYHDINIIIPNSTRKIKIKRGEWLSKKHGKLTFGDAINKYSDKISVNILSNDNTINANTFFDKKENNILHFFISDTLDKSIKTALNIEAVYNGGYMIIDSALITARLPSLKDTSFLSISSFGEKSIIDIEEHDKVPLSVYFSKIMEEAITQGAFHLYKDSLEIEIKTKWASPMELQVYPVQAWQPLTTYELVILRDNIIIPKNKSIMDSILTFSFSTSQHKKYGSFIGNFISHNLTPMKARLISFQKSQLYYDVIVNSDLSFKINRIPEGKYKLLFFHDQNNDNIYNAGYLKPYLNAEWFSFMKDTISIRNNWEAEISNIILE